MASTAIGAMATFAAAAIAAAQQPVPTPIGRGPAYHPAARGPLAAHSFACIRGDLQRGSRVHLEVFANRRVVIVPAGIGVAGIRAVRFGRIRAARCHARLWTLDPTGDVHAATRGLRLGDLFAVWGQPLGRGRLLDFRGRPLVFRNGRRVLTPASAVELRDRDEIVLEVNGYVPPHRSYRFPPVESGGTIASGRSKGP